MIEIVTIYFRVSHSRTCPSRLYHIKLDFCWITIIPVTMNRRTKRTIRRFATLAAWRRAISSKSILVPGTHYRCKISTTGMIYIVPGYQTRLSFDIRYPQCTNTCPLTCTRKGCQNVRCLEAVSTVAEGIIERKERSLGDQLSPSRHCLPNNNKNERVRYMYTIQTS